MTSGVVRPSSRYANAPSVPPTYRASGSARVASPSSGSIVTCARHRTPRYGGSSPATSKAQRDSCSSARTRELGRCVAQTSSSPRRTNQSETATVAAPTTLTPASTTPDGIGFPITQGKLILTFTTGQAPTVNGVRSTIGHAGGLSLKKGDVTVRVRNFVIVANTAGVSKLTAQVNGKRTDFGTLTFTSFPTITGKKVDVTNVEVRLTTASANALNTAFGTTLAAGDLVGKATVKARLVGKGKV